MWLFALLVGFCIDLLAIRRWGSTRCALWNG